MSIVITHYWISTNKSWEYGCVLSVRGHDGEWRKQWRSMCATQINAMLDSLITLSSVVVVFPITNAFYMDKHICSCWYPISIRRKIQHIKRTRKWLRMWRRSLVLVALSAIQLEQQYEDSRRDASTYTSACVPQWNYISSIWIARWTTINVCYSRLIFFGCVQKHWVLIWNGEIPNTWLVAII